MKTQEALRELSSASRKKQDASENTEKRNSLSKVELVRLYAPDMQYRYCKERERCVTGTAPRLGEMAEQYGEETAIEWVMAQLYDFTKFANCGNKLDEFQYKEMARMVLQSHGHLKLTEIMLFFNDCKAGKYVKLYGGFIDPTQLMAALGEFASTVIPMIISEWDKEQRKRREQEEKAASGSRLVGQAAREALNMRYARMIANNDFPKDIPEDDEFLRLTTENALRIKEMIDKQEFPGWLGGIARTVEGMIKGKNTPF